MHQDNKCYLVHENKHNATLDYIYIYIYIYILGCTENMPFCSDFFALSAFLLWHY